MISAEFTPMKTTALSSSDRGMPHFHFINDLFNMNSPITEMVYSVAEKSKSIHFTQYV